MMTRLPENLRKQLCCLILFAGTFLLFLPSLQNEFLNYDDDKYVTENELVKQGPSLGALYAPHFFMWHPLTTFSQQIDYSLYGLNPAGYRVGNIFCHCLSAVLVLLLVLRITRSLETAFVVAALFAWHPLRVESVVWVAERKDVLCTVFWLFTLHAYLNWSENKSWKNHLITLTACGLTMMSKPMAVTLPVTMLLLDFWPLKRLELKSFSSWRETLLLLVKEKTPFFVMSVTLGIITIAYQGKSETIVSLEEVTITERLLNALAGYGRYLGKLFFPHDLAVFYPPQDAIPYLVIGLSIGTIASMGVYAWRNRESQPQVLFGLAWFLVTLLPVIGLLQSGMQSMADRYSYLPTLGIILAVVITVRNLPLKPANQNFVNFVFAVIIIACIGLTQAQIPKWKNSETLFRHALSVTEANFIAHINLGSVLADRGDVQEALSHYEAALRIRPNPGLQYKLGRALLAQGQPAAAAKYFNQVVGTQPDHAEAHFELALALTDLGRIDEGTEHLRKALSLRPDLGHRIGIPPGQTVPAARTGTNSSP
ncbi:MAG: hypothetical protein K0Q55_654 [Verrucomicrobia bacterium]|jgi:tetratricopeptide (TPR) repeat protein|nr:hypothetical protein [Verrucomicrobiota bacterium]